MPLPPLPPPISTSVRIIAGFWWRLRAFGIDAFITAVPCGILGFALYGFRSNSRVDPVLIGFVLTSRHPKPPTDSEDKGVGEMKGTIAFDCKDYGVNGSIPFIKNAGRLEVTIAF